MDANISDEHEPGRRLLDAVHGVKLPWLPTTSVAVMAARRQTASEQVRFECRIRTTGVPCGYCHACGAELPTRYSSVCPACHASDTDE